MHQTIIATLKSIASPIRARKSLRFFKCAKGEYAYGDLFLGISNPDLRRQVKLYSNATLTDIGKLLHSKWHEIRLFSLYLLVYQYQKSSSEQQQIFEMYLQHTHHINNWDLVD